MADYGIGRTGGSLRDALNQLYPMTGLGEYGAMFPPNAGAPEPTAPVPLPQPRPQMPQGLRPGMMQPLGGGVDLRTGLGAALQRPQLPPPSPLDGIPQSAQGRAAIPPGSNIGGFFSGQYGSAPGDYAARLGLRPGQF